jgi:hypothetical protein
MVKSGILDFAANEREYFSAHAELLSLDYLFALHNAPSA